MTLLNSERKLLILQQMMQEMFPSIVWLPCTFKYLCWDEAIHQNKLGGTKFVTNCKNIYTASLNGWSIASIFASIFESPSLKPKSNKQIIIWLGFRKHTPESDMTHDFSGRSFFGGIPVAKAGWNRSTVARCSLGLTSHLFPMLDVHQSICRGFKDTSNCSLYFEGGIIHEFFIRIPIIQG